MCLNMKIEINADQPLDEVVRELESKGIKQQSKWCFGNPCLVTVNKYGYSLWDFNPSSTYELYELTTLEQLQEMK